MRPFKRAALFTLGSFVFVALAASCSSEPTSAPPVVQDPTPAPAPANASNPPPTPAAANNPAPTVVSDLAPTPEADNNPAPAVVSDPAPAPEADNNPAPAAPPDPAPATNIEVSDAVPTLEELNTMGIGDESAECFIATIDPDGTGRVASAELFLQAWATCL